MGSTALLTGMSTRNISWEYRPPVRGVLTTLPPSCVYCPVALMDYPGPYTVKCNIVQAMRLCTGRTAHRGSRGIALLIHDYGIRRE